MLKFLLCALAIVTSFFLGSLLAQRNPSLPALPVVINNFPEHSAAPRMSQPISASWRPAWSHWTNRLFDYYFPRSFVGNLIVGLHDPEMRSLFTTELRQAWDEVKRSTARVSPEAAAKLETDLEPTASRTFQQIQDRLRSQESELR